MGNIDGASKVLQMMKTQGIKVNENIFNSLILGHGEAGDMARSHGMLKVMKQWGLAPSREGEPGCSQEVGQLWAVGAWEAKDPTCCRGWIRARQGRGDARTTEEKN